MVDRERGSLDPARPRQVGCALLQPVLLDVEDERGVPVAFEPVGEVLAGGERVAMQGRLRSGTACFLDDGRLAVARGWVESGPDVERGGAVRRRVRDIRRKIEEAFGAVCYGRGRSPAAPE